MTERLSLSWCKVRLNQPAGISSHLIQYRKKSLPQVMRDSLRFNAVLGTWTLVEGHLSKNLDKPSNPL